MKDFPKIAILMLAVVITCTLGPIAAEPLQKDPDSRSPKEPGEKNKPGQTSKGPSDSAEVKITIRVSGTENTESLRLKVTFENVGDKDTVLNLGMMVGNGRHQLPDAIRLQITDANHDAREMAFIEPKLGARVDPYLVPLRAGSAYTVTLKLKDYWCPAKKEFRFDLKPGRYSVRAAFSAREPDKLNGDVNGLKFMPFWVGKLESDFAEFQIGL